MSTLIKGLRQVKLDKLEREYAVLLTGFVEIEPETAAFELTKLRVDHDKLVALVSTLAGLLLESGHPKTASTALEELRRITE